MVLFLRRAIAFGFTATQSLAHHAVHRHETLTERADWMHKWTATALRRLEIEYNVIGNPPEQGLVVSNHLSYLDIMIFGAVMRCVFVSKAEVKKWPLFGALASVAGTVYVDRTRRSDTRNANDGIARAFQQNLPVVIFPEGTSSGGADVLPFYPSLFEPAVENKVPLTAAYLSYEVEGGTVEDDVAYWGKMTFFPHLLRFFGLKRIRATIRFAEQSRFFEDRKVAAQQMREEVLRLKRADSPVPSRD